MLMSKVLDQSVSPGAEEAAAGVNKFLDLGEQIDALRFRADFELAQTAANGDMAAFEELYDRHHWRVYSICFRMLRNAADAEDLTQEVFIQLYRKIGTFRGDSAFSTWLHRLTVNQVLMHFRRRIVRFEQTKEEGGTPVQIASGTENPRKMPIIDNIALRNAISCLAKGYSNVFLLHDVEGYEHEEVAKILGCSVGTSKSQLHKARLKLQRLLLGKAKTNKFYIRRKKTSDKA